MKADTLPDDGVLDDSDDVSDRPGKERLNSLEVPIVLPSKQTLYRRALSLLPERIFLDMGPRNHVLGIATKARLLQNLKDNSGYETVYVWFTGSVFDVAFFVEAADSRAGWRTSSTG